MDTRERQNSGPERPAPETTPTGGAGLAAVGAQVERLLAAADDAIDRALSGNSDEFLRANRQSGGQ